MKVFVTGATGYIGQAVSKALLARGHEVVGLTRSGEGARRLRDIGVAPVIADFGDRAGLLLAIKGADADAVISTASAGMGGGTAKTFSMDLEAVRAMLSALAGSDRPFLFTSGSAILGTFANGERSGAVYDEEAILPLPTEVFAPAGAHVPAMVVEGFGAAMAARLATERAVLNASGVRGIVVRPGLVYGHGGSYDVPALIALARRHGFAPYLGAGATSQSYIHVDELAELYCLAVEAAPDRAILHGVVDEVGMRQLASSVAQLMGSGEEVGPLTFNQMIGLGPASRGAMAAAEHLPRRWLRSLQSMFPQPPNVASGVSASLNKRLSSEKTRKLLGWSPSRRDILDDIARGSYAS